MTRKATILSCGAFAPERVIPNSYFNDLLGDLALHKLDVVISDRPAPANPNMKLYSHGLGSSNMAWYGTPALMKTSKLLLRTRK